MDKIKFEITTQERTVYNDEIDEVILPTKTGQIAVLPHHIPLVSVLTAGELIVKKDGQEIPMAISGGFVEVQSENKIVVLANTAERVDEIDESRAEEARARAENLMKEKRADAQEYAVLAAKLQKELTRLKVARKHRQFGSNHPSGHI